MAYFKPLSYFVAIVIFMIAQSANAVGLDNVPNAHFNPHHKLYPEVGTLGAMLTEGDEDFWVRLRHEDVNEDRGGTILAPADDANQTHIRASLGYTTARYKGFYLRGELEAGLKLSDNALNLDDDFRIPPLGPGPNPIIGNRLAEGNAIIPDNDFAEVNEAYIGWRNGSGACANSPGFCDGKTSFKLGRQTIIYDNHRWIGDIVWRQNQQSFNAFRFDNSSIKNLGFSYAYIKKSKRLFGEESIFNEFKFDDGHLINLSYTIPQFGKLTAYGYLLDFNDNPRTPFPEGNGIAPPFITGNTFDSDTIGLRFVGRHEIGDAFDLQTEFEWANQDPSDDAGENPVTGAEVADFDDHDYYNSELGINWGGQRVDNVGYLPVGEPSYQIRVGREVLEGNGVNAVQTPLATVHAFQGWADVFVAAPGGTATPVGGIEDTSVTFQVLGLFGDVIGKNKIVVAYHDYEAEDDDFGPDDYGDELNLLWGKPDLFGKKNLLGAIKYADYDADDFGVDVTKWWLLLQYRYQ
jgi:hypothetical protein